MYHLGYSRYERITHSIARLDIVAMLYFERVRMTHDSTKCGLVREMKVVKADYTQN